MSQNTEVGTEMANIDAPTPPPALENKKATNTDSYDEKRREEGNSDCKGQIVVTTPKLSVNVMKKVGVKTSTI